MITKYRTYIGRVERVQVDSETDHFVKIGKNRHAKISDFECYHDTFENAKDYLIKKAQEEVNQIRLRLERANAVLGNMKGIKKPADE